ncbi:MAG TPA: DUF4160 domain-containing protein, partial [bacterium]|nr:DUF4160 domain-containing protein [bacterium]
FFFSKEETRMHVHVTSPDGESKFWMQPTIALANSHGLSSKELKEIERIVQEHRGEITQAWERHFRR